MITMDCNNFNYHQHRHRSRNISTGTKCCQPTKSSLFMAMIVVATAGLVIQPATSQNSLLNTPPVMVVDRNWRISETEQLGSIIARVRAEDAENDLLQFGLEPLFHGNYANPNGGDDQGMTNDKLPFRIDPDTGVVYLNESLVGRGGQNFFLYITVSDGQLTAKNEVYVNIFARNDNKIYSSRTPSITQTTQNISQFLPPFHLLPGVQSIRNQQHYNRPSNNLPPGFGLNAMFPAARPPPSYASMPSGNGGVGYASPPLPAINPSIGGDKPKDDIDTSAQNENELAKDDSSGIAATPKTPTTTRTKLTPVYSGGKDYPTTGRKNSTSTSLGGIVPQDASAITPTVAYSIKAAFIPVIIAVCGLIVAAGIIIGFLYRKRLCAISKTLKKKSKEEMAKKSNQSNISSNLTDDSRNSMVMQNWNGPMAYGNRYVPWEREQQHQQSMATSQLSTSVRGGGGIGIGGIGGNAGGVGGVCIGGVAAPTTVDCNGGTGEGVVGAIPGSGSSSINSQSKHDQWEFPRHRLKFFNILGEGAFGQVWRCEATDIDGVEGVTTVAVKTLKENAAEVEKNDLVSELQVMKSLEPHVNVVRLLGCCTDKDPIFVIIEYVNRGKLQTYLRNSRAERHYGNTHGKSNILTSGDLTSFMYQVAKGMDYLTSRGIIHRDLAARNILITDDHTCKVADFGFARDVVTSKIYERKSEGKLPIRWMAIESLYDNIFSVKSDIWSFGILMWEIVTLGSTPYPGISAADVMRKVRDGYRLEKPEHCRRELYNIMYYCWSKDANERPTFSEVVQMLDKLLHTEMDYIELERFPDHNYYNILNLSGEKL